MCVNPLLAAHDLLAAVLVSDHLIKVDKMIAVNLHPADRRRVDRRLHALVDGRQVGCICDEARLFVE